MAKQRMGPSWVAVILWLIFFWPVGLYLLVKKLTTDRRAVVEQDRKLPVVGWLMLFVGVVFLGSFFDSYQGSATELLFALFFFCGGLASLRTAKKKTAEGGRYRCYIDAIVNHGLVFIPHIAAFVGVKENTACKDLKKMIKMGYFEQAYIDENRNEIHLYQRQAPVYRNQPYYGGGNSSQPFRKGPVFREEPGYPPNYGQYQPPAEEAVTCRSCGAHNWIRPGSKNHCEYCGSPLNRK